MMTFFSFFEGLSPWWWLAFGITLCAIEMLTMSFFLIWPGIAAVLMSVFLAFQRDVPGEIQVAMFAALSVALTYGGRYLVRNFGDGGEVPAEPINRRTAQLIGRRARVIRFAEGEGTVEIDGIPWRARSSAADPQVGSSVVVANCEGTVLFVEAPQAEAPAR